MDQRIICIVANQRAGTTALQRAIELTGMAINYGEIFKTDADEKAKSRGFFTDFARANNIQLADVQSTEGATAVAKNYIHWLKESAAPKHVLIDVKFNAWSALSPVWRYPHEEPFFLKQLKQARAIFIFIWRESLVDQVLSNAISKELGIWHNLNSTRAGERTIEVRIPELSRLATLICRSEADMSRHLRGYSDKIVAKYEDLFEDGEISAAFADQFKKLTGLDFVYGKKGGIRQNSVPKEDIITNYAEAAAAINEIALKHRSRMLRENQ